jgi:adenosylhomocysteine nucleosidase
MKRIGIIAALPAELKPLVQGWKSVPADKGSNAWRGTIDDTACVAVCAGMGKEAAERACRLAYKEGPLDALISVGWAGALSCGMQPGEAYVLNEVVEDATGERFATNSPARTGNAGPLRIVTSDHVALASEKQELGQAFQAVLVDMEAAAVARFASRNGSSFYCLKAVSDTAGERLPDFSQYTDGQGHLQLGSFLAHVAVQPQYWPGLVRVGRNGKMGAVAIAAGLRQLIRGMQAVKGSPEVFGSIGTGRGASAALGSEF